MSKLTDAIRDGESLDPWAALAALRTTKGPARAGTNNPRVILLQRAKALNTMALVLVEETARLVEDMVRWSDGDSRHPDHRDGQPGPTDGIVVRPLKVTPETHPEEYKTALPPQDWWEDPSNWGV